MNQRNLNSFITATTRISGMKEKIVIYFKFIKLNYYKLNGPELNGHLRTTTTFALPLNLNASSASFSCASIRYENGNFAVFHWELLSISL